MTAKATTLSKSDALSKKRSSSTGTFRLESELLAALKEEADQKRTSLNTLISQILRSHAEYHNLASKGGMISMPKNLLIRIMEKLNEGEVIHLSEHIARNEFKDTILLMTGKYDSESVINFIESWCRVGGYPYRHHTIENYGKMKHSFVLQHDMGERWSFYLVELFKFAFEQTGTRIDFQHTPNTIGFSVEI